MGDSDSLLSLLALRAIPSLTSRIRVPHRPRWWRLGGWDKYRVVVFKVGWASTGHRGRVDARGRPLGGAPGLTRATGLPASAPSRDGRGRDAFGDRAGTTALAKRPDRGCQVPSSRHDCSRQEAAFLARDQASAAPKALRIVHHEKERRHRDPRFAVRVMPGAQCHRWPRALTRPRWPVNAKDLSKTRARYLSQPPGRHQRGRWGTLIGEVKEGMARRARGDRSQSESPTDPAQTMPARNRTMHRNPTTQATPASRRFTPRRDPRASAPPRYAVADRSAPRSPGRASPAPASCRSRG